MNIKHVREVFGNCVFELNAANQEYSFIDYSLRKHFTLKYGSHSQNIPPKVLILGPPGSGKYTHGKLLSQSLGTVHVSVRDLLKKEAGENPPLEPVIQNFLNNNTNMPE